jgi:hypothetical protein
MKEWIELIAILIMAGGLTWVCCNRTKMKKGIGVRVIQFLAVIFIIPSIIILALEGVIVSETTAALLGAIIGYILSGIGQDENSGKSTDPTERLTKIKEMRDKGLLAEQEYKVKKQEILEKM